MQSTIQPDLKSPWGRNTRWGLGTILLLCRGSSSRAHTGRSRVPASLGDIGTRSARKRSKKPKYLYGNELNSSLDTLRFFPQYYPIIKPALPQPSQLGFCFVEGSQSTTLDNPCKPVLFHQICCKTIWQQCASKYRLALLFNLYPEMIIITADA